MLNHPTSIRARVASEVAAGNDNLWSYVDALNMAMPSYARLGVLDANAADLTAMQAQFDYTRTAPGLFDATRGLWWRDASFTGTATYWSRGNGWALMALAKVLQILAPSDPRYSGYRKLFRQMASALVALQLSDGLWGADLRNPSAYGYEASGTAFFTYAMAWGITSGILDPAVYGHVINKAWTALTTIALQPSGEVGYIQGATTGAAQPSDGQPVMVTDTAAYGVGGFLLAGSQMMHIADPPRNLALPVVSGVPTQGATLRVSTGTWSGQPTSCTYAWRDCLPSGAPCTTIRGATSSSYSVQPSDVGQRIQAKVTAVNTGGATTAFSAATALVTSTIFARSAAAQARSRARSE